MSASPSSSPGSAAVRPSTPGRPRSKLRAFVVAARPHQWTKNLLVFAAPAAALVVGRPVTFGRTAAAALAFCIASSGTYLVNDAVDAEADRLHPTKRARPIAAGELSKSAGVLGGIVLLGAALGGSLLLGGLALGAVVAAYAAISLAYSLSLKHVPVLELVCISAGFVLRTVAGGVAAQIPISPWFLVVASSGSLLVAAGKRTAELMSLGTRGAEHRVSLGWYRSSFLTAVRHLSAAVTVGAYLMWALTRSSRPDRLHQGVFGLLSVIPFALAVLVVERALAAGQGGAPEELPLKNRVLQLAGAAWLACLVLALLT